MQQVSSSNMEMDIFEFWWTIILHNKSIYSGEIFRQIRPLSDKTSMLQYVKKFPIAEDIGTQVF